jgi:nucleoid-associated protein YgaU
MRYAVAIMLLLPVMMAGCKQQAKGPQTTTVEPPVSSMEALAPMPAAPGTETTPPPLAPLRAPVAVTPKPAETSAAPTPLVPPPTYTVQKGDTIYGIARKVFGSDARAKDIIAANPGIDPDRIKVGQVINLPEK